MATPRRAFLPSFLLVLLGPLVDIDSSLHSEPQAPGNSDQRTNNTNKCSQRLVISYSHLG